MTLDEVKEVERLIARRGKDLAHADEIRDELMEKKIILEDTTEGTIWTWTRGG